MKAYSLIKACGILGLSLMLFLHHFGYAQATCPADFSVCENVARFELTGGTPAGGTYSGVGVSSGKFDPAMARVGTRLITYSYVDENSQTRSCTFKIEVREAPFVNCTLELVPPFCLQGKPMNPERNCRGRQGSTTSLTGPGIVDNIFYPASVGIGVHQYTMAVTYENGCIRTSQGSVEVVDVDGPPTVSCPGNMTIPSATTPPVKLNYGSSIEGWGGFFSGKGIFAGANRSWDMFDPGIAGQGTHTITFTLGSFAEEVDEGQCSNSCSFNITVGSLPVTLTDFKATNSETNIVLNWKTVTENGFDRFEIERSQNPKNGFKKIHEIKGSDRSNSYSYLDSFTEKGVPNYYRLKMVDLDGSFAYSTIVWALLEGAEKVSVFPNPASRQLTVESPNQMLEVKLINAAGSQSFKETVGGLRSKRINLPTLPAGIYLLQVTDTHRKSSFSGVILN